MCVSSPHANLFNCLLVCLFNFNLFISYHNYNNFYITASEDDTHKDVTKYQEKNKKQQPTFVPIQSTCSLHTEVHTKTIYLKQVTKDVENIFNSHLWRNDVPKDDKVTTIEDICTYITAMWYGL